ncbi:dermonecrotic toxin domain-containing protein [Luteibacter sp.]|jgi:hypothetical protein|uniref:dermonecrotic toxin domain-containing protein n=1 Tax=Luteibacter sp. TaxID=1886636 RepID=UPI002F3EAE90
MLPPQAPPAHVSHANQAAIDSLQRLADTQRWLARQQDALPDLPPAVDGRNAFLDELDAFWEASIEHAPGKPLVSRRQAFALRLAQTIRDDAALRGNDGTLADAAVELIGAIALHPGGPLPGHLHARELLFGAVPYAGALVLQDDRQPERILLFTVEAGWQVFDSLDILYRDVELQMRAQLVHRDELPGIASHDIETVIGTHFLDTRPIDRDIFDTLARRLGARMRERALLAWNLASTLEELHEALHPALDLHALLDVHAIVRHRDLALAARLAEERLAGQPAKVADHWRRAATDYRDSWIGADHPDLRAPLSLAAFANDALATALRKRGIDVPPHELRVRLTRRTLENPVATAISGFSFEDMSLAELAFRNIGALPAESLSVVYADGSPRPGVPAQALRDIVRDLDLPNGYARHLDDALGKSPAGLAQRKAINDVQSARMRLEAADARLSFYDTSEPRSFLPDREERGFLWAQAVLDHPYPAGRARIGGHEIVVHQLTYGGAPLAGVFLLSARQSEAVSRVVLYTPDAPDGIAFREFGDRAELTRDFIVNPSFKTYLLDRLPAAFTEFDALGQRHFKLTRLNGNRTPSWVFSLPQCAPTRCTELAERFQEREVATSFLDAGYDTAIALAKRNANDLTRSTLAADTSGAWDVFWGWNLPVQVGKELVTGMVQSIPRAANSAWRVYDDVKAGDATGAFLAFVDGYTSALNVLPFYTQVPALAGARVRVATGSSRLATNARPVPAPDTLFESRFLARGVTAPAREPALGVFTMGADRYIRQAGKLYQVRFDSAINGWRLTRPNVLDTHFTGPAIERLANGQWHFRKVGLSGGSGRPQLHETVRILRDGTPRNPAVAALTVAQRKCLTNELSARLPESEFALTLRTMIDRGPGDDIALSSSQLRAWELSLEEARRLPASATATAQPIDFSVRPGSSSGAGTSTAGAQAGSTGTSTPYPFSAYTTFTHRNLRRAGQQLLDNARVNPALIPLTVEQRAVLIESLHASLPFYEYVFVLRSMVDRIPRPGVLSPAQLLAWDSALDTARRTPASTAPATTAGTQTLAIGRIQTISSPPIAGLVTTQVARQWPAEVYAYVPAHTVRMGTGNSVLLPSLRLDLATDGIPVTTLPPVTPMTSVPSGLFPLLPRQAGASANTNLGSVYGGWIRINLNQLSMRPIVSASSPSVQLLEVAGSGGTGFVLRMNGPFILNGSEFTVGYIQ